VKGLFRVRIYTGKSQTSEATLKFKPEGNICANDGKWTGCVTDKKNDTFFVRVEMSLDIEVQSWQCAVDKNLSTSGDCSGLNQYNVTHSYKEDNYLYSGILLKVKKKTTKPPPSTIPEPLYEIRCRKTNGKSNGDAHLSITYRFIYRAFALIPQGPTLNMALVFPTKESNKLF
jgi:hypothetical protein